MNFPFHYGFTWKMMWWLPLCKAKIYRTSCPVEQHEWNLFTVGLLWDERGYV